MFEILGSCNLITRIASTVQFLTDAPSEKF